MKTIYLIRHGESEGNASGRTQGSTSILTEKGRAQASYVAKRMAKIPITQIISSTFPRAKETAEIIHQEHPQIKEILFSDLLVERRRPSEMIGMRFDSEEMARVRTEIDSNFHVPSYQYSDEETFEHLKDRAKKATTFITEHADEHTIVVTHGIFISILVSYLLFKDSLSAHECLTIMKSFISENTGLTILKYDESKADTQWKVYTWNDRAHLADPEN